MEDLFGIGDLVICKVKSLNESQKILMRCNEKNLGVIMTRGQENERMLGINRIQIKGVQSGIVQKRKVALIN